MSGKDTKLPKYVAGFDTSGPVDYYVCELCKGNNNPFFFEYHLKEKHPEVAGEK
jgi:hypothetical protein